jgi:hypothetical protein
MFWGLILIVFQLLLTVVISMGAFYFKQLKKTIDEYKVLVEKRFGEGEERFEKIEQGLIEFKTEVYKGFVYKEDFIRILGSFECKFKEMMELIERSFAGIKERIKTIK